VYREPRLNCVGKLIVSLSSLCVIKFLASSETDFYRWPLHRVGVLAGLFSLFLAISNSPLRAADAEQDDECEISENLLLDSEFMMSGEASRVWRYSQHTGEKSFAYRSEDGELELTRISGQPWMILKQRLSDQALSGATIRFSAELKGDLPIEPKLHAFDHKAGLYLKLGRSRAELAEHDNNYGTFDWQKVEIERTIPNGVTRIEAGFIHQAGGTLWAREPELVIVDCE